jgi:protein phosphatase 1L
VEILCNHSFTYSGLLVFAAVPVSKDHKPDQTDERQRIEEAGGFVMWAGTMHCIICKFYGWDMIASLTMVLCSIGTWRVGGVLAVSRAFGDKLLKQYVVVDPEIRV